MVGMAEPPPPSPTPRRLSPPRWLDLRLVLGVGLVLGSVLLGARLLAGAGRTQPVVRVTRDLAAGAVLMAGDVELARVRLPGDVRGRYLLQVADAVGRRLGRPVAAGELLPAGALGLAPPATTITVPLSAAAAPDLRRGQRIELWLSTASCRSTVLLADVVVQAVRADGDSYGSETSGQEVVISVTPEQADRVVAALALDGAHLRAGVLAGPAQGPSGLPDLAACAPAPVR